VQPSSSSVVAWSVPPCCTPWRIEAALVEADEGFAYAASGTNSGIVHTGFDSAPGELETRLILRASSLRDRVLDALRVPVLRCGAVIEPRQPADAATIAGLARGARANGVPVRLRADGALEIPGESITDPVAFIEALARSAMAAGARVQLSESGAGSPFRARSWASTADHQA